MWTIWVLQMWVMMCKPRSLEHIEIHDPAHDRPRGIRWRWVKGSLDAMVQALPRRALALSLLPYPPYSRAGSLLVTTKSMWYDTMMHFDKHHFFFVSAPLFASSPTPTNHSQALIDAYPT